MKRLYVAIDVGCHECGIDSEVIGTYEVKEEAEAACERRSDETNNWRDGGQSIPEVFEISAPL